MPYQIRRLTAAELPFSLQELPLHSQPDLLNAFAKAYQVETCYLTVIQDTEFVACMPIFERKRFGLQSIISPQQYYYHFISFNMQKTMHPNRVLQRKIEILESLSSYMQQNYQKVSFNLDPGMRDVRGFTWSKMKALPLYTYLVPLKTIDSSHFFVNERNSLHKAEREDIRIEERKNIPEFLRLMKLTSERQQRVFSITEEQHIMLLEELFRCKYVRQFNAWKEEQLIATFLILPDPVLDTVYAWQHYTDPAFFSTGVSPLFFNTLFQILRDEFSTFDLCGANLPAISRYKAALGANLELFFRIQGNVFSWK